MKKVFGLLMGVTMLASIPVMADELVLRDSELDTVTAGAIASANFDATGSAVSVSATATASVTPDQARITSEVLSTGEGRARVVLNATARNE